MNNKFPRRFQEILANSHQEEDLAEAALLISQQLNPHIDIALYLDRLRLIAQSVQDKLPAEAGLYQAVQCLNQVLFEEEGFRGNQSDYYNPRNSYLHDVLDRRLGIPITLSILYISIGRIIGIPLQGVSFPGRFLVKFAWQEGEVFLDPYLGGISLDEPQMQALLDQSYGTQTQLLPAVPALLQAASRHEILLRLLRNLKAIHLHNQQYEQALLVLDCMLSISPDAVEEVRDRAMVYDRLECFRAALEGYQHYLRLEAHVPDKAAITSRIATLSKWESQLH